jgi:hypothetical protein
VPVQILGVNELGHESELTLMYEGRALPLLQDTPQASVWPRWRVAFRDVVILDKRNATAAVVNVGNWDLGRPVNYELLKSMLRQTAESP